MKTNLTFTPPLLTKFNKHRGFHVFLFLFALPMMWLTACSEHEGKETPEPVPEPDQPAIVIPDTENTAPVMEQAGGTTALRFTASAAWTAEANAITRAADWISVQPTHGEAGEVTLTITTQPNDTYDERNAAIIITCDKEQKTLTVSQKQRDALLVSSNKIELEADGGDFTIQLQANVEVDYEIEESASWLTATDSKSRALDDITLAFHAEANTSKEARQATVTLSGSGLTETVTVYQAGTAPFLILSQKEYLVSAGGETIQVELRSNTSYKVQLPEAGWIAEADTRAVSAYTHYFTIAPNDTYDARTAEILFTSTDGTLADTLRVTQVQQDAIVLAQQAYDLPAESNRLEFPVLANVDVTATTDVEWITPVPDARGLEEKNLRFDVSANTDSLARQGTIILSGGNVTQEIVVRQAGYKEEPELVDVKYRRSWIWEEAHDNLPLLYYACVDRDRYYDNGEVVTDRFVDIGHIFSLLASREYTEDGPFDMAFGYKYIRGGLTTSVINDSVHVEHTYEIVPSLNSIIVHKELTDHIPHDHTKPGNWDEYSVSKLYDESLNIPGAEAIEDEWERCSLPSGWYFWGLFYYMGQRDIDYSYYYFAPQRDNETVLNRFSWLKWTHDQFLVIDGRRIDFLDYYGYDENLQVNITEEDISNPVAKVVTYEGKIEYLGRNFSATMIDTIYEQKYDLNEVYYFRGGDDRDEWNWWLGASEEGGAGEPIEIEASQQPIVTTDADWIHIDGLEQGEKSPISPVQLNVCTWTVKWSASPNTTNPRRQGYIYFKNKKGEALRKALIEQQSADFESLLMGTFEFDGDGWTQDPESPRYGSLAWYSEGTFVYHKNKLLENTTHHVEAWDGLEWEETDDDIIFHITPHLNNDDQCLSIHIENENVDIPVDIGICQDVLIDMQEFVGNFEFQGSGCSINGNEAKLAWNASGTLVYHKKWVHDITPTYKVEIDNNWSDLQWSETDEAIYFHNITPNITPDPRGGKIHLSFGDDSMYLSIIQDPDFD